MHLLSRIRFSVRMCRRSHLISLMTMFNKALTILFTVDCIPFVTKHLTYAAARCSMPFAWHCVLQAKEHYTLQTTCSMFMSYRIVRFGISTFRIPANCCAERQAGKIKIKRKNFSFVSRKKQTTIDCRFTCISFGFKLMFIHTLESSLECLLLYRCQWQSLWMACAIALLSKTNFYIHISPSLSLSPSSS